ncbi:MAG: cupin domain-containing protein [Chloroflexota bacterium]
MERREPYATPEEFARRVIHYPDLPFSELAPGSKSQLVSSGNVMVSFLDQQPNSYFAPHRHDVEQVMIVLDGEQDEIVEGKLYRVKKGDVLILPPNTEHGGYIPETGCKVIDLFCPPRKDLADKARKPSPWSC